MHVDYSFPGGKFTILLTTGDIDGECVRDLLGLFKLPIGTGFFKMTDPIVFEDSADLDCPRRREAAYDMTPSELTLR